MQSPAALGISRNARAGPQLVKVGFRAAQTRTILTRVTLEQKLPAAAAWLGRSGSLKRSWGPQLQQPHVHARVRRRRRAQARVLMSRH
jgi:hypothetical protein